MKQLMYAAVVIFLLGTAACQTNTTNNNNNNLDEAIFSGTIAGAPKEIKSSTGGFPGSSYGGWSPDLGGMHYGFSINAETPGTGSNQEQVGVDIGFFEDQDDLDTVAWKAYFAPGKTFNLSPGTPDAQMANVSYTDAAGNFFDSKSGPQTGATFTIDAIKLYDEGDPDNRTMKMKVTFKCKVYDSNGQNPKQIEGYLIGAFSYYIP